MTPMSSSRGFTQRGAAIIEFAIALPVLLILMFATAEVGRLLSQYNTLTKSVRDSARYVASKASGGTTRVISITAQVRTAATNLAVTGNIAGGGSALLPGLAAGNITIADAGGGYVSVSAAYTYVPLMGSTFPRFGRGGALSFAIPLTSVVLMRVL